MRPNSRQEHTADVTNVRVHLGTLDAMVCSWHVPATAAGGNTSSNITRPASPQRQEFASSTASDQVFSSV